jgi:glycosyltransferase involved in cell wall biosynthesis
MKVLFALYPSNRWIAGGKERQIKEMYSELRQLGVDVTLHDTWDWDDDSSYDILHVFGSEYYQHELTARAKARGMKVIVSSILVYPNQQSERRIHWWKYLDKFIPVSTTFGLRKQTLCMADRVICASKHESHLAQHVYGVQPESITHIPLTVSPEFSQAEATLFTERTGLSDVVLSVGRIEPRKNAYALIEAMEPLGLPLVLIGGFDPNHQEYGQKVRQAIESRDWITHIPHLAPDDPLLASAYAAAKVHALVSHHEMVGLVVLEAGLAGSNIVTSPLPSIQEYLQHWAWYADPNDTAAIRRQLEKAYHAPFDPTVRKHILDNYSTGAVAEQLRRLYTDLVG